MTGGWLPDGFATPARLDLPTGHHLRPIRETDVDLDYLTVMGSRERLWARYGEAWGWPPATMTYEQDREDLARHQREIEAQETFNYAVLDEGETELLGCVYIDPPDPEHPSHSSGERWPSVRHTSVWATLAAARVLRPWPSRSIWSPRATSSGSDEGGQDPRSTPRPGSRRLPVAGQQAVRRTGY